ncbi:hypothetical protein RHMOL_Rhmol03G0022200 [Rhododendron molle]|uniref:Uncharacterized protein n=1 Tax=Rhododendron molle TaxID=49168 RepID=A0ACC0P9N8_RHOML|nr:hypothetical protein RHMOL_Rhmol03G0022200 [Rhododendron molle]
MIYLWVGNYSSHEWDINEDEGNKIFDELVEKGFIQPIYQNCSLEPNSCRMSLSVRSTLYKEAERRGFTSNDNLDFRFIRSYEWAHSSLINIGEAIINWKPEIIKNKDYIRSLHLGRCTLQGEQSQGKASKEQLSRPPPTLPPRLQKLDLQCFPTECLTDWLWSSEIWGLKKLYIRGGILCDLGQIQKRQGNWWSVEILRLKYLRKLKIDWSELEILFPNLIHLHQEECPKLTNFPCDERGVWMNVEAPCDERTEFDELRKDVTKLRLQISSRVKICPADSNPHRKRWPNINEAEDRMSHYFYKEPEDAHIGDFDGLLEAFHDLCLRWRHCLLCFFKFPPEAIIKR